MAVRSCCPLAHGLPSPRMDRQPRKDLAIDDGIKVPEDVEQIWQAFRQNKLKV